MNARTELGQAFARAVAAVAEDADCHGPPLCTFRSPYLPGVRFELRPISMAPCDKAVAILYRREGGNFRQAGVGVFKEGLWTNDRGKPLSGEGLHWALMVGEGASVG